MTAILIDNLPAYCYHHDLALPEGIQGPTLATSQVGILLNKSPAALFWSIMESRKKHHEEGDAGIAKLVVEEMQNASRRRGTVMHSIVLRDGEIGGTINVHDYDAWTSKDAKAARNADMEAGLISVKSKELDEYLTMARVFGKYEVASMIRVPGHRVEASIYYVDNHNVSRRCRVDLLPPRDALLQGIGQIDYKTTAVSFDKFDSTFLYNMDGALRLYSYTEALIKLWGVMPNYWLLVQQMDPPYSVQLKILQIGSAFAHLIQQGMEAPIPNVELPPAGNITTPDAMEVVNFYKEAGKTNNAAVMLWKNCLEHGAWPHPADIETFRLGERASESIKNRYPILGLQDDKSGQWDWRLSKRYREKGQI